MSNPARGHQEGFTLIEVMVSILIFTVGVIGLIGMQSLMISNSMDAESRIQASFFANRLIGQMWVDRGADDTNLATYDTSYGSTRPTTHFLPGWIASVETGLPGASGGNTPTVTVNGNQVDITIRWQLPSDPNPHTYVASAIITRAD
jgi:type IV pilus assembly protein PilV